MTPILTLSTKPYSEITFVSKKLGYPLKARIRISVLENV